MSAWIREHPQDAEAYVYRGVRYMRDQGDYGPAIKDFDKAIELGVHGTNVYTLRAHAHEQRGDYPRAMANCLKALERDPNDMAAYWTRATAYEGLGQYALAIADHTRCIELGADAASVAIERGRAYFWMGDFDSARADWKAALHGSRAELAEWLIGQLEQERAALPKGSNEPKRPTAEQTGSETGTPTRPSR